MRFIGDPFTFGLQQLSSNITIMSSNAAAATEDFVFWMGIDTFYIYAGQTQTLPCTVKDKVFLDFNLEQRSKVVAGVNTEFSEVIWFYPSSNSTENDRYVTYNYAKKYGTLEHCPEQHGWTVEPEFSIATGNNLIYNHEIGYDDDGSAMNSFIESAAIDMAGGKFTYLRKVIPDLTLMVLLICLRHRPHLQLKRETIQGQISITHNLEPQLEHNQPVEPLQSN